jgi:hypothetical protein
MDGCLGRAAIVVVECVNNRKHMLAVGRFSLTRFPGTIAALPTSDK